MEKTLLFGSLLSLLLVSCTSTSVDNRPLVTEVDINKELITAAEFNEIEEAERLIEDGADINWQDTDDMTAFMWSIVYKSNKITELCLVN